MFEVTVYNAIKKTNDRMFMFISKLYVDTVPMAVTLPVTRLDRYCLAR